jgi:hypothetical protein
MKKLILTFSILLFALIGLTQTDTTVFFTDTIVFKFIPDSIDISPFRTVDTVNYNEFQDSTAWRYSVKMFYDTVFINQNKYITKDVQFRRNKQGIKQRRIRKILWVREALREQKIRYK